MHENTATASYQATCEQVSASLLHCPRRSPKCLRLFIYIYIWPVITDSFGSRERQKGFVDTRLFTHPPCSRPVNASPIHRPLFCSAFGLLTSPEGNIWRLRCWAVFAALPFVAGQGGAQWKQLATELRRWYAVGSARWFYIFHFILNRFLWFL